MAAAAALLLGACGDDDDVTVDDLTQETEPNEGIFTDDLSTVIRDSDEYIGEEVTVSGQVVAQIDETRFQIGDGDGNGLLVFGPSDTPEFGADAVVRVSGTVRTAPQSSVGDDSRSPYEDSGTPYDEDVAPFLDKLVIEAESVEVIEDPSS